MSKKKVALRITGIIIAVWLLALLLCYATVSFKSFGRTYDNVEDVPEHEYGLLLGTSPFTTEGARMQRCSHMIRQPAKALRWPRPKSRASTPTIM